MKPLDPIAQAMRKIQRATDGGRVTLTMTPQGRFVAHAYLPSHLVSALTIRRLEAEVKGVRSVTLDEVNAAMEATAAAPMQHGRGKEPIDALDDLLVKLVEAAR